MDLQKKRFAIISALVIVATMQASPVSAAPVRYEAESATISQGLVEANHLNFSGTGFVNNDNVIGSYTEWTVNAASAGNATLTIRYANGTTTARPADVAVNGAVISAGLSFGSTGNWDTWANKTLTAALNAGANTVRVTGTTSSGPPNLDFLDVDAVTSPGIVDYQAETATISQGVVESNHAGFTGTGFVNYNNAVGSYVEWTVPAAAAGNVNFSIRYANGTTTNRPMNITVNGLTVVSNLAFNGTGAWTTWADQRFTAAVNAGNNLVRATATTVNGGPNVDRLRSGESGGGAPTADELLAKVTTCTQISNGRYKTDSETAATIPVCQKTGAVFWKADMDIDCDGIRTTQCNENTDCCFQPQTFCQSSTGTPLNAAQLPYTVMPSPSIIWDYRNFQIGCGTVVAIIYQGQVLYTVVGDTGPSTIIGEASYASAAALGINPDPKNGGTDSGVTYIVFQGSQRVSPIENHANAVTLGESLARTFVNNN